MNGGKREGEDERVKEEREGEGEKGRKGDG